MVIIVANAKVTKKSEKTRLAEVLCSREKASALKAWLGR